MPVFPLPKLLQYLKPSYWGFCWAQVLFWLVILTLGGLSMASAFFG